MSAILGHSHPDIVATVQRQAATLDHLFSGMLSRARWSTWPGGSPSPCPTPLDEGAAADHRRRVERGGDPDGQAGHRQARDRLVRAVLARHDRRPRRPPPTAPGARGTGRPRPATSRSRRRTRTGRTSPTADGELDWRRQLDFAFDLIDAQSVGSLAACIVEPILSSGGVIDPPPGYLAALQDKCRERGMLLILDEAQTGLCRTGTWYAFERDGVVPDILTLSKTLGAGLPLAAVVTSAEIEQDGARARLPVLHHARLRPAGRRRRQHRARRAGTRQAGPAGAPSSARSCATGCCELADRHEVDRRRPRPRPAGRAGAGRRPETKQGSDELGAAVTRRCLELGPAHERRAAARHGRRRSGSRRR